MVCCIGINSLSERKVAGYGAKQRGRATLGEEPRVVKGRLWQEDWRRITPKLSGEAAGQGRAEVEQEWPPPRPL
jgi:hypothetical protein